MNKVNGVNTNNGVTTLNPADMSQQDFIAAVYLERGEMLDAEVRRIIGEMDTSNQYIDTINTLIGKANVAEYGKTNYSAPTWSTNDNNVILDNGYGLNFQPDGNGGTTFTILDADGNQLIYQNQTLIPVPAGTTVDALEVGIPVMSDMTFILEDGTKLTFKAESNDNILDLNNLSHGLHNLSSLIITRGNQGIKIDDINSKTVSIGDVVIEKDPNAITSKDIKNIKSTKFPAIDMTTIQLYGGTEKYDVITGSFSVTFRDNLKNDYKRLTDSQKKSLYDQIKSDGITLRWELTDSDGDDDTYVKSYTYKPFENESYDDFVDRIVDASKIHFRSYVLNEEGAINIHKLSGTLSLPEYQVNEVISTKYSVIEYTVQNGDAPIGIASKYGISYDTLKIANPEIANSYLITGQILNIPINAMPYKVVSGDAPTGIASKFGIAYEELKKTNPEIESSPLQVGQTVYIPINTVTYKTINDDTLGKISNKLNVSLDDLKKYNPQLPESGIIDAGMDVYIPTTKSNNDKKSLNFEYPYFNSENYGNIDGDFLNRYIKNTMTQVNTYSDDEKEGIKNKFIEDGFSFRLNVYDVDGVDNKYTSNYKTIKMFPGENLESFFKRAVGNEAKSLKSYIQHFSDEGTIEIEKIEIVESSIPAFSYEKIPVIENYEGKKVKEPYTHSFDSDNNDGHILSESGGLHSWEYAGKNYRDITASHDGKDIKGYFARKLILDVDKTAEYTGTTPFLTQKEKELLSSVLRVTYPDASGSGQLTPEEWATLKKSLINARDNLNGSSQIQTVQLQRAMQTYNQNYEAMSNAQQKIYSLLRDIISNVK